MLIMLSSLNFKLPNLKKTAGLSEDNESVDKEEQEDVGQGSWWLARGSMGKGRVWVLRASPFSSETKMPHLC